MRLILTSCGLNRKLGRRLIHSKIATEKLEEKIIFIITLPDYGIDECLIQSTEAMGFQRENIYLAQSGIVPEEMLAGRTPHYIYVTEGNIYAILEFMRKNHLVNYIKNCMQTGETTYIGASAGAMLAGKDIRLAEDFDKNEVGFEDIVSLGLFDGTAIPHYTKTEFKRYISNTDSEILAGYKKIYSIGEKEALVLEI